MRSHLWLSVLGKLLVLIAASAALDAMLVCEAVGDRSLGKAGFKLHAVWDPSELFNACYAGLIPSFPCIKLRGGF